MAIIDANHNAVVNVSATGIIVAAPANANQFIRVYGWHLSSSANVTIKWQSFNSTTTTDKTGPGTVTTGVPHTIQAADSSGYLFDCQPGDALQLFISGSGTVGGFVVFMVRGGVAVNT